MPMLLTKDCKNIEATVSMEGELRSVVNYPKIEERGALGC